MPDLKVITIDEIAHNGQEITVHFMPDGNSGRGGKVLDICQDGRLGPVTLKMASGENRDMEWEIVDADIHHITTEVPVAAEECLDYGAGNCRGPVDYHWTGGSRSWPRCDYHQEQRMKRREESIEKYADSDVAPSWFDPAAAGERWEDDY